MLGLLEGQCAVITGAANVRGIGYATAKVFAEHGARVALLDLDGGVAVASAAGLGDGHMGVQVDVTDERSCSDAIEQVLAKFGRIDCLVNNAGVTQAVKLLDIQRTDYDFVLDVNLRGGIQMSQAVLPALLAAGSGSIIFISSVTAQRGGGVFGGPHYAAAKAGLIGLAKSLAREFGGAGLRVNAVAPGVIDTDITKGRRTPEERLRSVAGAPLERLGTPTEVANGCLFLASSLSSYITGTVLDVNGGMHIH